MLDLQTPVIWLQGALPYDESIVRSVGEKANRKQVEVSQTEPGHLHTPSGRALVAFQGIRCSPSCHQQDPRRSAGKHDVRVAPSRCAATPVHETRAAHVASAAKPASTYLLLNESDCIYVGYRLLHLLSDVQHTGTRVQDCKTRLLMELARVYVMTSGLLV